ncbi:hypothetical protein EWB00_004206 [Schistosoma japonicum]|uniref:Uncharacterized protein n=1 Tax=Schistosoma japonicum TaxID=6182 RepID=A0A4Z2DV34_SCHJA|nr:hypothetical protein EWB00_004206 [Schistosoma japonicum]
MCISKTEYYKHSKIFNCFAMTYHENSFVMDVGLLADLSKELRDRICAETLSKLQKRTDRELFTINREVDRVLKNESYIKSRLYSLVNVLQTDQKRSMKIRSTLWNRRSIVPSNKKMSEQSNRNNRLKNDNQLDMVVHSAPPRITLDHLPPTIVKSGRRLYPLQNTIHQKSEIFPDENNKRYKSEHMFTKTKEQGNFATQWRPESDPLRWSDIQFTTIDSEAREKSRNRLCGAFNATSFQLIYAQ